MPPLAEIEIEPSKGATQRTTAVGVAVAMISEVWIGELISTR